MERGRLLQRSLIEGEILSRLPVKSLLRFRCACKRWCDLISNPYFISLHLKRGAITNNNLIGYRPYWNKIYTLDPEKPDQVVDLGYPLSSMSQSSTSKRTLTSCLGWCDGLTCLFDKDGKTLSLLNPSTKKHMITTQTHSFDGVSYGFFVDPISCDYKLIEITPIDKKKNGSSQVMVYTFGEDAWNTLGIIPYKNFCQYVGKLVAGVLHWILYRSERFILAFNPVKKAFVEVPQPEYDLEGFHLALLGELGGCLGLVGTFEKTLQVWIMKEYGVKESWVKSFVMNPYPLHYIRPVCIMQNGDLLWKSLGHWGLHPNQEQQQSQSLENSETLQGSYKTWPNHNNYSTFVPCVESLISFQVGENGKQKVVGRNCSLS